MVKAVTLARYIKTLAKAAQEAGVTHLQLSRGPIASMVIAPPEKPAPVESEEEREARKIEENRRILYGEKRGARGEL